ncbi:hypothetical protein ACFLXC_00170 [Chloroflexota bacterium]
MRGFVSAIDIRPHRWPIADFWQIIQNAISCFGEVIGVSRIKQMRPSKDILERNLKGYAYSFTALATMSMPGKNVAYGKNYLEHLLFELFNAPDFEAEVQKRMHKYASMEY